MKIIKILSIALLAYVLGGCNPKQQEFQGYIEGYYTYISPNFSGILQQLLVARGTFIKAGTPLFILEQQPESADVKQIQGQLTQAQAQKKQNAAALSLTEITLQRQKALYLKNATSKESVDIAESNFNQAVSQVAAADANIIALQAALEKAIWAKGKKTVFSPIPAFVFDTFYTPGELVEAGQPILALLASENIYALFYVPESVLGKIKMGQNVQVRCDSCPESITAKISYISPQAEYTPPVIFSQESKDKLVYRIEAYPETKDAYKFHPGQPVLVTIQYE